MKLAHSLSALLLFAASSSLLAAEDIYRSVMPDGRVVYGESVFPGAKTYRKVPPPPTSTGVITATDGEKAKYGPRPSPQPAATGPSVAIIPQQRRPSPEPAQQGRLFSPPNTLPQGSY